MAKYYQVAGVTEAIHDHEHTITGKGTVFTFVVIGTPGQTAKCEGSIDGINWVTIFEATVTAEPQAVVTQISYPHLRIDGTAKVQIARG